MTQRFVNWAVMVVGTIAVVFCVLHVLGLFMFIELTYSTPPSKGEVAFHYHFAIHNEFRHCWMLIEIPFTPERGVDNAEWDCVVYFEKDVVGQLCLTASHIVHGRFHNLVIIQNQSPLTLVVPHPVVYLPCALLVFTLIRCRLRGKRREEKGRNKGTQLIEGERNKGNE